MPNIFKPKRSSTASSVPTISNLADGELAVNTADQKIYVRSGASIVTVGSVSVGGGSGVSISTNTTNQSQYLTYASATGTAAGLGVTTTGLVFNPSSGNLGIGTTLPSDRLDVNGNIRVRSAIKDYYGNVGAAGSILTVVGAGIGVSWTTPSAAGLQGTAGTNAGFPYTFSTTTTAADPGSGFFRFNSAVTASITEMYISDLDTTGTDRSGAIIRYDDTSGTDRATIYLPGPATGGNISITVTGAITDNTTWLTIPVSFTSGGLPANSENRNVIGVRNGVQGVSGPVEGSANQIVYKNASNTATGNANFLFLDDSTFIVGAATSTGTASQPLQVTGGAYVSGNLGVGVPNPTEKLTVTGNALVTGIVTVRNANTQDGITLLGRSGGTGSFDVILTPTTLSADRTLTLPDVTGTVALTSQIPTVDVTAAGNNAFTGANTFTNATGQTFRAAATQDGIIIDGRSGGTTSLAVTIVPTTLTANRTLTLADGDTTLAAGTMVTTGANSAFTGANTFTNATGQTIRSAATQDGIILSGRAGGTTSLAVTLIPTTLTASRTVTLPDASTTIPVATQVLTFSGPTAARTITLPDANFTAARTDAAQTFTAAQTFRAANAVRSEAAATQDAVVLAGRAGGTSSFAVTLTPTTLASNTTLTLPNVTGTVITTGDTATVTNTMLSTVATSTIRGRVTAGTGVVENLTGTQATTLLDTFTSALKGLAPASGGGTTNFLRADGTWAAPPSGSGGTSTPQYGIIIASTYGMFMP
jgi:hypothetical protein